MSPPSVSVVIPAYNEEKTLRDVAEKALRALSSTCAEYEVVIMDDGSADNTARIADGLAAAHPGIVRSLRHPRNMGIAATFADLQRAAAKEFVMDISGDGQIDPAILETIVPLLATHDIVVCRRIDKGYSPLRGIVSYAYRALPEVLFATRLYDPGCAKCIRRTLIDRIPLQSTGVFREAERLIRAERLGYRIGSVDIRVIPRPHGRSLGARLPLVAESLKDLALLWLRLIVLRQNAGAHGG